LTFDHNNNLNPKIGPSSTNTPKSHAKGTKFENPTQWNVKGLQVEFWLKN
jgi:hypothetical protein